MDDMATPQKGKDGFGTWKDIASFAFNIVYNSNSYRDDLVILMMIHAQVDEDGFVHLLTNGRKNRKNTITIICKQCILCVSNRRLRIQN